MSTFSFQKQKSQSVGTLKIVPRASWVMLDLSGAQGWCVLIPQRQGTGEEEHIAPAAVGWYSVSWQQADPWAPRYEKCFLDGEVGTCGAGGGSSRC